MSSLTQTVAARGGLTLTSGPARLSDIPAFAEHIRDEDRREWVHGTGQSTMAKMMDAVGDPFAIARAIYRSDIEYPVVVWGAQPLAGNEQVAWVWLAATPEGYETVVGLHKLMPGEVQLLDAAFKRTITLADVRNTDHLRWLRWMGFVPGEIVPTGPWAYPYQQFTRDRH